MLGHTWRIRVSNTQNQNIAVTLKARYFKYNSDGSLGWSIEQTLINSTSVSATIGSTTSSTVDNSTDKYIGAEFTLQCTAAATTNGTGVVAVYVERSTDSGTTWPSQDQGIFIGGYTVTATDGTVLRIKNLLIR